ncbi:DUF1963 domain-containing protein [Streptomyces sp. CA-250714]|uniref:DUF1963 domain-containing protein n=1 Tax=Streptomyces sp. CA-250714 TaxID=3240060 RepID=UPI003D8E84A7
MTSSFDVSLFAPVTDTLTPQQAQRWLRLLRPGIRLRRHREDAGEGSVVGHFAGLPGLPEGMAWPSWEGRGPMHHQATLDCALLPTHELDIPLPPDGELVFFYFDSFESDCDFIFVPGDHEEEPGAGIKLLYIPASEPTRPRQAPYDLDRHTQKRPFFLNGIVPTWPDAEYAVVSDITGAFYHDPDHPSYDPSHPYYHAEVDLAAELGGDPASQVGGYAPWGQPPVVPPESAEPDELDWVHLATFEAFRDGWLHWMIYREDLAEGRFDRAEAFFER